MFEYTTTRNRDELIRMFIDGSAEEVYESGRLATVPTENGVQLVAYGNEIIAENEGGDITIFTSFHSTVSKTVTTYIKRVGSILNDTETRSVEVRESAAPTLGIGARASQSAQYISNYVGDLRDPDKSPVEEDAMAEVDQALNQRMAEIFG